MATPARDNSRPRSTGLLNTAGTICLLGIALVAAAAHVAIQGPRELLLDPDRPEWQMPAPEVSTAVLDTSKGRIVVELRREWAPHGVDRFYNLVRFGFYDDARFFRVRPGTWVQFGIPGDPEIAQRWRNRTIPDDPRREPNVRGTIAFAFKDPNGRSTQVFINLRDNRATHDKEFVPIGRIVEGLDVADALYEGYAEGPGGIRAGTQDPVFQGGTAYLLKTYPRLDYIVHATIRR
jgi:cyclophilin family peptidyl-prolyl cis-trans isomerase